MKRRDKREKKKEKTREMEGVVKKIERSMITEKPRSRFNTFHRIRFERIPRRNEQLLYFIDVSLAIASFIRSRDQRLWISVIVFASSTVAERLTMFVGGFDRKIAGPETGCLYRKV